MGRCRGHWCFGGNRNILRDKLLIAGDQRDGGHRPHQRKDKCANDNKEPA